MRTALLFNSGHPAYAPNYDHTTVKRVLETGIIQASNRHMKLGSGDVLLEPGWRADNAIHGLGRTNRTNQKQPPLFRPIATNVKAEKRFLSTIAHRLDTLGAITRGQRQTGGQGLFRPEDNGATTVEVFPPSSTCTLAL